MEGNVCLLNHLTLLDMNDTSLNFLTYRFLISSLVLTNILVTSSESEEEVFARLKQDLLLTQLKLFCIGQYVILLHLDLFLSTYRYTFFFLYFVANKKEYILRSTIQVSTKKLSLLLGWLDLMISNLWS